MPLGLIVVLTRVMTVFGQSVGGRFFRGISSLTDVELTHHVKRGRGRPFIVQSEVN